MQGFKDFIRRGNVIELAVAVIMGTAFTAIVNAIVESIINPVIAALFNADEITEATLQLGPVSLGIGEVIGAIINFVLIAVVVYFLIIMPINKLNERIHVRRFGYKPGEGPGEDEPAPTQEELLTEIRDLLAKQDQNR